MESCSVKVDNIIIIIIVISIIIIISFNIIVIVIVVVRINIIVIIIIIIIIVVIIIMSISICLLFSKLRLYERGQSLSQSVYSQACSGLNDDNEDVRRKAVKIVWVLSRLYPERWVPASRVLCSAGVSFLLDLTRPQKCNTKRKQS